ncbi:carboxypeptidase regulatory-like domain-containing protein [Adlercreutzia sp. ZJ242]|uniref:carboxypeptidase regulatory-like domain-containing protein n=1 Tax=Adlercreutzia sp. ZJ242 TaxID=2709409 RepID=UPI0013EA71CF|nr:carboxypeptidase regulatory-like domain-containing protein [Adlercreutzia sp. ZJ242]
MKAFVIDIAKCNGCHNCQIVCKDEHCGNDWSPYAKTQPDTGQFWCSVEERVRGTVPLTRISYIPRIGAQTEALREYAGEVLMPREDGLIVIDPEKAKGREDIAEKFEGVYWNAELQIPQGCTGCAHLLDNGWAVPRCVDACPTDALRFGDEDDLAEEIAQATRLDDDSHVYYLNFPKRFIGGTVVDLAADEVVIGAEVYLKDEDGKVVSLARTDDFGDFIFKQVEPEAYRVEIKAHGFGKKALDADAREADLNLGTIDLSA